MRGWQRAIAYGFLFIVMAIGLFLTRPDSLQLHWNDETLYYTVARNILERGSLDSHHYLSVSLVRVGYPTRDTHLPGYPLVLSLGFWLFGVSEATPFFLNWMLLGVTLVLVFEIGWRLASFRVGILASLLCLFYPTTLVLAHSAMTETLAGAVLAAIAYILVAVPESRVYGDLKGAGLAGLIALSYLVKPFLLITLPATLLACYLDRKFGKKRMPISLISVFTILAITCLVPLSQNQEFYPYEATTIFSAPDWTTRLELVTQNVGDNLRRLWQMPLESGEKQTSLVLLLAIFISTVDFWNLRSNANSKGSKFDERKLTQTCQLYGWLFLSLFGVVSAIFMLYNYSAWRGVRSLSVFVPVLAVLTAMGGDRLWKLRSPVSPVLRVILTSSAIALLLTANLTTVAQLRTSQARQSAALKTASDRLQTVLQADNLNPEIVMSAGNFYYPVAAYPRQVIWQLPETLQDWRAVKRRVTVDVVELPAGHPLLEENRNEYGTIDALDGAHTLVRVRDGYYYYQRNPPSTDVP